MRGRGPGNRESSMRIQREERRKFPLALSGRKPLKRKEKRKKYLTDFAMYARYTREYRLTRCFRKAVRSVEKRRSCQLSVESNGTPVTRKLEPLFLSLSFSMSLITHRHESVTTVDRQRLPQQRGLARIVSMLLELSHDKRAIRYEVI